jgi:uncharacterized repeat protein (TIGR01451 family)
MAHRWRGRRLARRLVLVSAALLSVWLATGPGALASVRGANASPSGPSPIPTPTPSPSGGTPDLQIRTTSNARSELHAGDVVRYTIAVTNVGAAAAHGVQITDRFPDGLRYADGPPALGGGSCTVVSSIDQSGNETLTLVCTMEVLAAGASATVSLPMRVVAATSCGRITNEVSVSARDEPRAAVDERNRNAVTDQVACSCGVAIVTTPQRIRGVPGDLVVYRYHVTNTGNSLFRRVIVTDDLLGHIGHVDALRPGHEQTLTARFRLPSRGIDVRDTGTATATDQTGTTCSARDAAIVTLVEAAGGSRPPAGGARGATGGTAFTGAADLPLGAAIALGLIGAVCLLLTRRRSTTR